MVWEQRCRGVVMLNRVIEKGSVSETLTVPVSATWIHILALNTCLQCMHMECVHGLCVWGLCCVVIMKKCVYVQIKCAQYWPQREEREAVFEDTNFRLTLISEDVKSYYTVRQLELENLSVRRLIFLSFHPVVLWGLYSPPLVTFFYLAKILVFQQNMLHVLKVLFRASIAGQVVDLTVSGYCRCQRFISDKHMLVVINAVVACV